MRAISAFVGHRGLVAWCFALFALGACIASCDRSHTGSAARSTPRLAAPSQPRLVALSAGLGVTLRDLGLSHLVVGRHGFDLALDPSIPVSGDQSGLDYDALLRVQPTHVLLEWGARPLPPRLIQLAEQQGWTINNLPNLTLDDIRQTTARLQRDFGDFRTPHQQSDWVQKLDRAWQRRGNGFASLGRVLLLGQSDPPAAIGPGSFHHQILERVGGVPAISHGAPWIELSAEDLIRLNPDAVVLVIPRSPSAPPATQRHGAALLPLLGKFGTLKLAAAERGTIALIDDPFAHTPSTAMAAFAEELVEVLERWDE
ncbi:MAG: hypothetical protein SFZ23_01740 [Planctomycetota bacterium]|nr:hypothetical protein [Planctomycetota bacterium]